MVKLKYYIIATALPVSVPVVQLSVHVATFKKIKSRILSGEMTTYTRINESGRKIDFYFCKVCGTKVIWDPEIRPGMRGLAGRTCDDTSLIKNPCNIWGDSKQDWYQFPDKAEKKDSQ